MKILQYKIIKVLLLSIISGILLITAYLVPYLNWLVFIAFVPLIIALKDESKINIYIGVLILLIIYISFVLTIYDGWKSLNFQILILFLLFLFSISKFHQLSNKFNLLGIFIPAILFTVIVFIVNLLSNYMKEYLFAFLGIMPVSNYIYNLLAGTYVTYLIIFIVIFMNYLIAYLYNKKNSSKKFIVFISIVSIVAILINNFPKPILDIPKSSPEEQDVDGSYFTEMDDKIISSYKNINSVLVVRNNLIVFEKYYNGCTKYTLNNLHSATKSFTNAMIGASIYNGYIKDVDEKLSMYYQNDSYKIDTNEITIKNLLTMTGGFDSIYDFGTVRKLPNNYIKYILDTPLKDNPDEVYNYNNNGVHLLSGIVNKSSNLVSSQFMDKYVFSNMGIYRYIWGEDSEKIKFGHSNLFLSTRDMAKFGMLYLNDGIWYGKRLLPKNWVSESSKKQVPGDYYEPHGEGYGYLFWITKVNEYDAYFAGGYGGQFIHIIPDLNLITVITSDAKTRNHEEHRDIIEDFIVPSIKK